MKVGDPVGEATKDTDPAISISILDIRSYLAPSLGVWYDMV